MLYQSGRLKQAKFEEESAPFCVFVMRKRADFNVKKRNYIAVFCSFCWLVSDEKPKGQVSILRGHFAYWFLFVLGGEQDRACAKLTLMRTTPACLYRQAIVLGQVEQLECRHGGIG